MLLAINVILTHSLKYTVAITFVLIYIKIKKMFFFLHAIKIIKAHSTDNKIFKILLE